MSFHSTVESMSKVMDKMGITELELDRRFLFGLYNKHIHISKQSAPVFTCATPGSAPETKVVENQISGHALKSPMVGVVYFAPEPGAKPFINVGTSVKAGDTVALVEAMKTFNPIKSDKDGVVKEILAVDGAAVEFDQPLIVSE